MLPQKEQQIIAMMHVQVIHDGVDALQIRRQLGIDPTEKVQKGDFGPPWIALRKAVPCRLPQRPEDVAFATATIIQLLFRSLGWPFCGINELRSLVAFGRDRSHLIEIENGTLLWLL